MGVRQSLRYVVIALVMFCTCLYPGTPASASSTAQTPELSVRLISKTENYKADTPITLGLAFEMQPGWHIYTNPPGDAGLPTEVQWQSDQNARFSPLSYPPHQTFDEQGLTTFGYANSVLFTTSAISSETQSAQTIQARVSWLACKSVCIPGSAELSLTLPTVKTGHPSLSLDAINFPTENTAQSTGATGTASPQDTQSDLTLWLALVLAMLGGLILNLMPCVFPVLALKVFHFTEMSAATQRTVRHHSLIYVAGALTGFALIGGLLAALSAGGSTLGWGYQLQSPGVVLGLALLMLWVGLDLAEIAPQTGALSRLMARIPIGSSPFITGLLAVAVASPCTAPFMSGALGYAALQSPMTGFLVIMAVGTGFALPFAILAWFPALLRFLPKPGAWMLTLKKILAIPMFAATGWLIWVLSQQVAPEGLYVLAALLALIAISCSVKLKRHNLVLVAIAMISTIWFVEHNPRLNHKPSTYPAYSPQKLSALRAQGRAVLVDFTAAWCITCSVNERSTLYTDAADELFAQYNVERLTGDWTQRNSMISQALRDLGRNGVPVYALYLPGRAKPILLPELLTPSILETSLATHLSQG